MRGTNQRRAPIAILERPAQLLHQTDQRRVGHERSRPETLVQLVLPDDARCFDDEQRQQIERLRRQMDSAGVMGQHPLVRVERERPESRHHSESLEFPLILARRPPDLETTGVVLFRCARRQRAGDTRTAPLREGWIIMRVSRVLTLPVLVLAACCLLSTAERAVAQSDAFAATDPNNPIKLLVDNLNSPAGATLRARWNIDGANWHEPVAVTDSRGAAQLVTPAYG